MNNWGFNKIYLSGFSFDKPNSSINKLGSVMSSINMRKLCVISETFEHDIVQSISKNDFYNLTKR